MSHETSSGSSPPGPDGGRPRPARATPTHCTPTYVDAASETDPQNRLAQTTRLVICCDGTACSEYIGHEKTPITNVSRIARSINQWGNDTTQIRQIVAYLPGIGTDERTIEQLNVVRQGTGKGLKSLVMQSYTFLSHNWTTDQDEIILIGFSRGAFAMRCLADFIIKCGLLRKHDLDGLRGLYKIWREHTPYVLNERPFPKIKVCATWDTVATLKNLVPRGKDILPFSMPNRKYSFVHSLLPEGIENAFQALALHEHRYHFLPIVWVKHDNSQNLEQCWFTGYHRDIGGGSEDEVLSHFALAWIIGKLQRFLSISVDQLWTHQDPKAWRTPKGEKLPVQDSRSMKWIFAEWMSLKVKFPGSAYRRPCYQFADDRHLVIPAGMIGPEASKERIHFSTGFLQFHEVFERYGPFLHFNPEEDEFVRIGHTRHWSLKKPRKARRSRHDRAYEVQEDELDGYEKDVLQKWVKAQLRKLQIGAALGTESRSILGTLNAYLDNPPRVDQIQEE
ncbi:hypothetical protein PG991_014660 [Apiospora marii]|uniref:T6SS Phospholipase effector Tle1-like catalytic domain-containing protein n=1 Tax=Apiospora marii TaxID=335849 RepID=A0ABR1R434_9PEZI